MATASSLTPQEESDERSLRFQKVMDAIQTALDHNFEPPEISDEQLNRLITEARQAAKV